MLAKTSNEEIKPDQFVESLQQTLNECKKGHLTLRTLSDMLFQGYMHQVRLHGEQFLTTVRGIVYDPLQVSVFKDKHPVFHIPYFGNCIELRQSTIHGRGVFAKSDILANAVITLYGGDKIILSNEDYTVAICPRTENDDDETKFNLDYRFKLSETFHVEGNPINDQNPRRFGMFMNDGVMKYLNNEFENMTVETYQNEVKQNINCMFMITEANLAVAAVATRNIAKGEEIVTAYGWDYWEDYQKRHSQKLIRVVQIDLNQTCRLVSLPVATVYSFSNHIELQAMDQYKLQIRFGSGGPINSTATLLATMLARQNKVFVPCSEISGIVYLLLDNGAGITSSIWDDIRSFTKKQKASLTEPSMTFST